MIMAGTSSRRLIHFDLLQEGLEYFHIDSSAAYRRIRSWMDGHGFDHDQLSGYLSRSPLTDREVYRLHDQFIRENPEIAACIEGFQVSTITQNMELSARTTRKVKHFGADYEKVSRMARATREARNRSRPRSTEPKTSHHHG